MKPVLAIAPLLFGISALAQHSVHDTQCIGVIHGVAIGRDGQPVKGLKVILYPLGVDLAMVLPRTETDQRGEYRFEHACPCRYTVLAEDEKAGYPYASPYLNMFLYGRRIAEVKITAKKPEAELCVNLPPKPGHLQLRLINSQTKARIVKACVKLRISKRRWIETRCDDSIPCDAKPHFLIPPDQDVLLHVTSDGFREWHESAGRGKLIHVASGNVVTLDVELDPIQN